MRHSPFPFCLLLLACAGCFPQAKNPVLVSNVSSFYVDETEKQARAAGVDYEPTMNAALRKDPAALATLFRLTSANVLKGDGADAHATLLWCLLREWGDKDFSAQLSRQNAPTRQNVVTFLDFAADSDYRARYPLTYKMARHSVRFGG